MLFEYLTEIFRVFKADVSGNINDTVLCLQQLLGTADALLAHIGVEGLPRLLFEYAAELGRVHMDMLRCRRQRQRLGKVLCDKAADLVDGRVGGRAQIPDVGE